VIVLNASLSRNVITNQVEEKAKQFRSTFRLMGLIDMAYTCGTFLSNTILILLGLIMVTIGNFIFNHEYMTSTELWHFLIASFIISLSIMALNSILSLAISNPKTAADVGGIYVFSITFMYFFLTNCLKF
jgi:hypothetical protein